MDFLKEILGEELFAQFKEKVDAYNGDEAHAGSQVKLANLTGGEYVGKGKYDALQEVIAGKDTELESAKKLIEELKKSSKGNEDMQGRIAEYEQENARLQEELAKTRLMSAVKVELLSERAVDIDYLTFKLSEKLSEKGETLELDESGHIKGWDEHLAGLKTQFPAMFESAKSVEDKKIEERKLGGDAGTGVITKADILKKSYAERVALYESNPDAYNEAMS